MIKVLIVEDERRTARAIGQLVQQHPGFSVVGTEANGADALIFLGGNNVDLIITDIRMPVMDGMELLKIVRHKFPDCVTVVLSGYSDFEYARAAIQHDAFDYLLKPINKGELYHLLNRIAQVIRERSQAQFREQILSVLDGSKPSGLSAQVYVMVAQQNGWNQAEQSARLQQCFGAACHLFSGSRESERLLVAEASEETLEQTQMFFQQTTEHTNTPIRLICTERPVELSDLNAVALRLRTLLEQKLRMFRSDLFVVNPREMQSILEGKNLRELKPERAVDAISAQNREELLPCLEQVLLPGARRADVQNYLDAIIHDSRIAYCVSPGKLSQAKTALSEILANDNAPERCRQDTADYLLGLLRAPTAKRSVSEVVEEIVQQMEANYHTAISVESLAKQYNFVPRYLNKVFKDHTGVRPMEYLLTLRINRAKSLLEAKPDALVKDIANSVGYSDPLYFSRIFKKETGSWPTEYQNSAKK